MYDFESLFLPAEGMGNGLEAKWRTAHFRSRVENLQTSVLLRNRGVLERTRWTLCSESARNAWDVNGRCITCVRGLHRMRTGGLHLLVRPVSGVPRIFAKKVGVVPYIGNVCDDRGHDPPLGGWHVLRRKVCSNLFRRFLRLFNVSKDGEHLCTRLRAALQDNANASTRY